MALSLEHHIGRVANMPNALKHYYNHKIELNKWDTKKCMLCGHKEISQTLQGSLYMLNDVVVHHLCIMLSLRSVKNGRDKEGIWGYLLKDIKAEITQASKICVYCNKKGATLSCMEANCSTQFHLPCGLKNGSMHHYFQSFNSFCQHHRIQPVINVGELHPFAPPTVECGICNGNVIPSTSPTSIWVPCCSTNGWFHRECVQDLALRKGYFIKCPKCEDVDKFKSRILILGIYIPSKYVTFEKRRLLQNTIPDIFDEFSERTMQCDAERCLCPHKEKRNFQNQYGWMLVICRTCEDKQTHIICSSITFNMKWNCDDCQKKITSIPARRLELPIEGNSVGISAVLGDFDSTGQLIQKQPFTMGYIQRRE